MGEHTKARLYVGSQNDGLFIIDKPPRPSTDDITPGGDTNVIAKIPLFPEGCANARHLTAYWNQLDGLATTEQLEAQPDAVRRLVEAARAVLDVTHTSYRHRFDGALRAALEPFLGGGEEANDGNH